MWHIAFACPSDSPLAISRSAPKVLGLPFDSPPFDFHVASDSESCHSVLYSFCFSSFSDFSVASDSPL